MIRTNARNLSEIRLKDFCPRCFYLKYYYPLRPENPYYSPMAGVLSTLNSQVKQVVNESFRREGSLPEWMRKSLGDLEIKDAVIPKKEKAQIQDVEITGQPDAIWKLKDGSIFIADYNTARLSPSQDTIFPLYETQLNAHGYLLELKGERVFGLVLIYLQPKTYKENLDFPLEISRTNLTVYFDCASKFVDRREKGEIEEPVREVKKILTLKDPPHGK